MRQDKLVVVALTVVTILFLSLQLYNLAHSGYHDEKSLIRWGKPFQGYPLQSSDVIMDCEYNGRPICCSVLRERDPYKPKRPKQASDREIYAREGFPKCATTKTYQPSPYEALHIRYAEEISLIEDEQERRERLAQFIFDDASTSAKWLQRVAYHMKSRGSAFLSEDDMEYLSRFRVTQSCDGQRESTWYEWLEPLSLHARHPFAIANCSDSSLAMGYNASTKSHALSFKDSAVEMERSNYTIMNVDYVLLHNNEDVEAAGVEAIARYNKVNKYLFDIGTSTFDSSLFWFLCAYQQRDIEFDRIFGWEQTLLEPEDFWKRVPPSIVPFYSFYNKPINATGRLSSVMQIIKQIARTEDFVSLKLDIDTPSIEIPLIMQLLSDHSQSVYIDELFFELHFRCEFLMYCGWGTNIPYAVDGLVMDRFHALQLFQKLRQQGIRAHFWP